MRRPFLLFFTGAVLLALFCVLRGTVLASSLAPFSQPQDYQLPEGLDLRLWTEPEAATPGDKVTLNLSIFNARLDSATPEVTLTLPGSLAFDLAVLPAGTTFNIQSNTLSWQPLVSGNGGSIQIALPFRANVADLKSPEQTISAVLSEGGNERVVVSRMWIGVPPVASIAFDPPQAAIGQPVQLLAKVTGPGPNSQSWSLGDGRVLEIDNPIVVFPSAGNFQVTLQVSNPVGTSSATNILAVLPQPIARFTIEDETTAINQPVTFLNQSGGQQPLNYSWDFGDGTTSQDADPIHQYSAPGTYVVRLTVQNNTGSSEYAGTVVVGQSPVADMIIDDIGDAGRFINAQAFTDDTATEIRWDMGDGRSYLGGIIEHIYWAEGDYFVTMTASNDYGQTQVSRWIRIQPGTLFLYLPLLYSQGGSQLTLTDSPDGQLITREIGDGGSLEERQALEGLELPPGMTILEKQIAYVNEARRLNGLGPLSHIQELSAAAQAHTDDMSAFGYTGHSGSDGSHPALRVQLAGYSSGYGGEATAWGMKNPIEPVLFWMSSPSHRTILLHPAVTEIGVGFTEDFNSSNIWYWTAEFGSPTLPFLDVLPTPTPLPTPTQTPEPEILLLGPPQDSEFALAAGNNLIFTWNWPEPLKPDQRFAIYLKSDRTFQIGAIYEPQSDTQYQYKIAISDIPVAPESYEWQVRLEDSRKGLILWESQSWSIRFLDQSEPVIRLTPTMTPTPTRLPEPPSDS